jgi:hypothetical protein
MGFIFKVDFSSPDPRLFTRDHNRALRAANEEAAALYHKQHMPDHFKMVGYSQYKFDKRAALYTKRKYRKYHHALPNVFTGNTRREMLANRTIRATPKGARLIMKIPIVGGTGQFRIKKKMKLRSVAGIVAMTRRIAELESISEFEVASLATWRRQRYIDLINRHIATGGKLRKRAKG